MECHQFLRYWTVHSRNECPPISKIEIYSADQKRLLTHLETPSQRFPQRMAPDVIRLTTVMKACAKPAVISGPDHTVMETNALEKRLRLPALHPGRGYRNPIDCAAFNWHVTTNFLEAESS